MVALTVVVQPFASVIVKVCNPAGNPVCAGVMVYGAVPPIAAITADPVDCPKHSTFT